MFSSDPAIPLLERLALAFRISEFARKINRNDKPSEAQSLLNSMDRAA